MQNTPNPASGVGNSAAAAPTTDPTSVSGQQALHTGGGYCSFYLLTSSLSIRLLLIAFGYEAESDGLGNPSTGQEKVGFKAQVEGYAKKFAGKSV